MQYFLCENQLSIEYDTGWLSGSGRRSPAYKTYIMSDICTFKFTTRNIEHNYITVMYRKKYDCASLLIRSVDI